MDDCIFCKISRGELPASKVYEDDSVMAFMDIRPVNPGHVLIVPRTHAKNITEVPLETAGKMFQLAKRLHSALLKCELQAEGSNFLLSNGAVAGQEVFHAHLHVIPRRENDGLKITFPEREAPLDSMDSIKKSAAILKNSLLAEQ